MSSNNKFKRYSAQRDTNIRELNINRDEHRNHHLDDEL